MSELTNKEIENAGRKWLELTKSTIENNSKSIILAIEKMDIAMAIKATEQMSEHMASIRRFLNQIPKSS